MNMTTSGEGAGHSTYERLIYLEGDEARRRLPQCGALSTSALQMAETFHPGVVSPFTVKRHHPEADQANLETDAKTGKPPASGTKHEGEKNNAKKEEDAENERASPPPQASARAFGVAPWKAKMASSFVNCGIAEITPNTGDQTIGEPGQLKGKLTGVLVKAVEDIQCMGIRLLPNGQTEAFIPERERPAAEGRAEQQKKAAEKQTEESATPEDPHCEFEIEVSA